jgi:hypothetical protein
MAQIREGQFAVMRRNDEDLDLMDLSFSGALSVEIDHENYSEEIGEQISQIEEGDILYAQVQGEDILFPNAIWRFLEIEIVGNDPGWAYD